jgi:hypothetical protein
LEKYKFWGDRKKYGWKQPEKYKIRITRFHCEKAGSKIRETYRGDHKRYSHEIGITPSRDKSAARNWRSRKS